MLTFKIDKQTIEISTAGKIRLQEAIDEAFVQSKLDTENMIKSVHIGHVGAKCLSGVPWLPIDSVDPTKPICLVITPKHFLVEEDDEKCLSAVIINTPEFSRHLSNMFSSTDTFRRVGKPIPALSVLAHITHIAGNSASLDNQFNGFGSSMMRYYELEKARSFSSDAPKDSIRFSHLGFYFTTDLPILVRNIRDTTMGGVVATSHYSTSLFGSTTWHLQLKHTQFMDDKLVSLAMSLSIHDYEGYMTFADLGIEKLSDIDRARLTVRGERFERFCNGPSHQRYEGTMYYKSGWWSLDKTYHNGRVMVDPVGFIENNANYPLFRSGNNHYGHQQQQTTNNLPLWTCWPTLPAFCLSTMTWGEVLIDNLRNIDFNENAFDRLVLDDDKKRLIRAIVENPFKYADLVEGKSMGSIFLLHGKPGIGKTSSAEAVSEVLRRPLYKFTSGQLGVTPTELYKNLNTNLKLAQRWNAVGLIDEVDIYLEKRADNDIIRNAMVGIFLNLLEYYQGVLFLTTNRVKCFDDAFQSRISIALHYKEFSFDQRSKVWEKHLEYANLSHIYRHELGKYVLNGRQIGTCIRIATSLAASEGLAEPTYRHLEQVIQLNQQWTHEEKKE